MNEVTQLLDAVCRGETDAADRLLPLVYEELRRLAAGYLDQEKPGQTLQPTALVHEAYLRLVGGDADAQWQGRSHFLASAALAMRHILIDSVRRKQRTSAGVISSVSSWLTVPIHSKSKRSGSCSRRSLDSPGSRRCDRCRNGPIAHVRRLVGRDAGKHLGLSRAAAYRQWAFARAWLRTELTEDALQEGVENK